MKNPVQAPEYVPLFPIKICFKFRIAGFDRTGLETARGIAVKSSL
ncbi:MAG: hypothetical protein Pg6C_16490 [Treponemataceae bacterium]|nr:MAG: hypothetical protein Pg6C_16490 [Treponemataceae bacterium]